METSFSTIKKTTKHKATSKKEVPKNLIYETINGKPIYYKGYKQVINNEITFEEIMGSSDLQALIIDCVVLFLHDHLDRNKYKVMSNELGIHLDKNSNLAADIAIYEKDKLKSHKFTGNYMSIPPKIVIEVDTKADLNDFDNAMDYIDVKTKKLFLFGVEKVFWILTKSRKVIAAIPNDTWGMMDWTGELILMNDIKFTINQLVKEDGIMEV